MLSITKTIKISHIWIYCTRSSNNFMNLFQIRCVSHHSRKKQPIRVNEIMTFVLNQSQTDIKHPFDLEADQIWGAFINKTTKFDTMNVNLMMKEIWERKWEKDSNGKVAFGCVTLRKGKIWEERVADIEKVAVAIRRQAKHKETKTQRRGKINQEQHVCHVSGRA